MRKCVVAAALIWSALPVGFMAERAQAASVADFYELAKPDRKRPVSCSRSGSRMRRLP